jgi:hypothetical protein
LNPDRYVSYADNQKGTYSTSKQYEQDRRNSFLMKYAYQNSPGSYQVFQGSDYILPIDQRIIPGVMYKNALRASEMIEFDNEPWKIIYPRESSFRSGSSEQETKKSILLNHRWFT